MQRIFALVFSALWFASVRAENGFPMFESGGLVEPRAAYSGDTVSWLDGGLGKTRYGAARAGEERGMGRLAELSLLVMPRFSPDWSGFLHVKQDAEQDIALEVVEAFLSYRPIPRSNYRFKALAGAFFPPISLEHVDTAWTSPYTITPSAINSWVGEELRSLGVEAGMEYEGETELFGLSAAAFGGNDPAGTLLAWRGWALHDRKTGLEETLPMAPLHENQFSHQARQVEPFIEIDNQPAYYLSATWQHLDFSIFRVLFYTNPHPGTEVEDGQYIWTTRFVNLGLHLFLSDRSELLAQYMDGITRMGRNNEVDNEYQSFYVMLSHGFGPHRVSLRYDNFRVDDEDGYYTRIGNTRETRAGTSVWIASDHHSGEILFDDNNEDGSAWTLAYGYEVTPRQRLLLEVMRVVSERPGRAAWNWPVEAEEVLWQASYRMTF